MNSQHFESMSLAEQAASWAEELADGEPGESAAFLKWLKGSPLHVKELLLASRLKEAVRSVDRERRIDVEVLIARAKADANVVPMGTEKASAAREATTVRSHRWRLSLAAGVLLLAVASTVWFFVSRFGGTNEYVTRLGEQRMIKLSDGSVVFLNTQSRMKLSYTDRSRDIYLTRGQALFQVQHEPARAFRVHAAAAIIQAIGTQFDVRVEQDHAMVAVVEGAIQVTTEDGADPATPARSHRTTRPARIGAGEGTTIDSAGRLEREAAVDTRAVTAWREQRLIFHATPLSEMAAEFNRYNSAPRLRVEGEALRNKRFEGSFNALQPQSLLTYLSKEQGLYFERHGDEVTIRER